MIFYFVWYFICWSDFPSTFVGWSIDTFRIIKCWTGTNTSLIIVWLSFLMLLSRSTWATWWGHWHSADYLLTTRILRSRPSWGTTLSSGCWFCRRCQWCFTSAFTGFVTTLRRRVVFWWGWLGCWFLWTFWGFTFSSILIGNWWWSTKWTRICSRRCWRRGISILPILINNGVISDVMIVCAKIVSSNHWDCQGVNYY